MNRLLMFLTVFTIALLSGCGGGGGSTGTGGVSVFITDNLNSGYDHVWVTLFKVELKKQSGEFVSAYDNASGQVVDLRALNNGTPIYSFLNFQDVPSGSYTGVRVTLSKDLVLYPTGATTGTPQTFSSDYDSGGKSRIEFDLSPHKAVVGTTNLVIDFDLSQWNVTGSGVTVAIKEGDETGLNHRSNHQPNDCRGVVSNLSGTSPTFTFTLALVHGGSVTVKTDATTGIYASDGSSPTLANGQTVTARGVFWTMDNSMTAASVRIKVGSSDGDSAQVSGVASNFNEGASTFDVTVQEAEGFVPTNTVVHIVLDPSAKLFSGHCIVFATPAAFYHALGAIDSPGVEVQGTYDLGSNTLTATKVKIETGQGSGDGAKVKGTVAVTLAPDGTAGTLSVVVSQWSGVSLTSGATVPIITTGTTSYRLSDTPSDKAGFFAGLTPGTTLIEFEGTFDGTTLTATRLSTVH